MLVFTRTCFSKYVYLCWCLRVLTLVSTSYSLLIFDSKILNRKGIYLSLTVQIIATFTRCENE